jgi:hypothetical protein
MLPLFLTIYPALFNISPTHYICFLTPDRDWEADLTFRPRVHSDIPNFAELQREFENELKAKKQAYQPTVPTEFSMLKVYCIKILDC